MSRMKHKGNKGRFFKRAQKKPVKTITVLPSLVTLLNGAFGFASIVYASMPAKSEEQQTSFFVTAATLIFLGMIADMLDGQLARMSASTSSFGGQLDSLCDVITFGVTPAFLMLKVITHKLGGVDLANEGVISRFVWLAALTYVSCGIIRLARFNVENEKDSSDHSIFVGLPSPAAAGVLASLVIFNARMLPGSAVVPYVLPFASMCVGALMVARIRYPHVVNYYFKGRKPFSYLIRILLGVGLIMIIGPVSAMTLLFCGFAVSSPLNAGYKRLCGYFAKPTESESVNSDLKNEPLAE